MGAVSFLAVPGMMRRLVRHFDWRTAYFLPHSGGLGEAMIKSYVLEFETKWGVICEMAKTPATKKRLAERDFVWKGFVNITLSTSQKEGWRHWADEYDNLFELLAITGAEGFKLTLTWNKNNENWVASLTCQDMTRPEGGYCLSAFGRDVETALYVLMYKHTVVCGEGWPIDGDGSVERADFG